MSDFNNHLNVEYELEAANGCLAMIHERILFWGKALIGPEYNLDSTPPMFFGEAMHNLLVRASQMDPEEFKLKQAK